MTVAGSEPTLLQPTMLGEMFGGYKAVAKLGAGGMGEVFLAEHQRIVRRAAIKVLVPELTQNADVVQRFFTEARATSLIRHPGIVEVFDCDIHPNGRAYIVMEHLEGETLGDLLDREERVPWTLACKITAQVAAALGAAHERGIVHRDLKPENVFLCAPSDSAEEPKVKVLDFGIAKLLANDQLATSRTGAGMLLGTPTYMSPEQCRARSDVDHRADIYALGCIAFEMLAGRPPFVPSRRMRELLIAHMFHPPPALPVGAAGVPTWLEQLVGRMLAKQPNGRPASMAQVVATLARAHGDRLAATPTAVTASARRRLLRPVAVRRTVAAGLVLLAGAVLAAQLFPKRRATHVLAVPAPPGAGAGKPLSAGAPTARQPPVPEPQFAGRATPATVVAIPRPHRASTSRPAAPTPVHPPGRPSDPPRSPAALDTDGIVDL